MSTIPKAKGLFFDSDEEEDVNFLRKNKNVFKDDADNDDQSHIQDEVTKYQQRREQQLRDMAKQDEKNQDLVENLQQQAKSTLLGGALQPQSSQPTPVKPSAGGGPKSNILFNDLSDDDDVNTIKTEEEFDAMRLEMNKNNTQNKSSKFNTNETTKGVFVPTGSLEWDNDDTVQLKAQQQKQKDETNQLLDDSLFNDDFFTQATTTTTTRTAKPTPTATTAPPPTTKSPTATATTATMTTTSGTKPKTNLDFSLFGDDDDDDSDVSTPLQTKATLATLKKTSTELGGLSLFDDDTGDDDPYLTGMNGNSEEIADDFDFAKYVFNNQ